MQIRVSADLRKATRFLDDAARRQVPFATAKALTATADAARIAVTRSLPETFDRPTPFTLRAIGIKAARKGDLSAAVFVKDKQAEYLAIQETGGEAQPKKAAFVLPRAARVNQYGNLPRAALARAKARPDVFVGKVAGHGGFWQRTKQGLKMLVAFASHASYRPRFGFQARVERTVRATIGPAFREALKQAMATARR